MTTYIDVSRLLTWEGNYTGMERVAYEITHVLVTQTDIELCCHVPGQGFLSLKNMYAFRGGRLVSEILKPGPGLRELLKQNKPEFLKQYIHRHASRREAKKLLQPLVTSKDNTLLIYDGLWDRQEYIDSVILSAKEGIRLAHIIHDAIPVVCPQVCLDFVTSSYDSYFKQISPYIDLLFSVSANTQKDFDNYFGKLLKGTVLKTVIHSADDFDNKKIGLKPQELNINAGKYILSVGTIEIRKNHQLLYQTYRLAGEKNIALPPLVIVGREGWLAQQVIYAIKTDPNVKDKIILAGPINDTGLRWLYKNCLFTVFPSVYEGWGLPVAESLCNGKVCAASRSSSIPEIGGDLNLYYSPYDPSECLEVVKSLLDEQFRRSLENKIRDNYATVRWTDTAGRIISVIRPK
ncbi:MAG: glycosyltransferase family 1 protein [Candidatus Saccharimonadales bacterium]